MSSMAVVGVLSAGVIRVVSTHRALHEEVVRFVQHDIELADDADDLIGALTEIEAGRNGYLLTQDPYWKDRFERGQRMLENKVTETQVTVEGGNDARERDTLVEFRGLLRSWLSEGGDSTTRLSAEKFAESKQLMEDMRRLLTKLRDDTVKLARDRKRSVEREITQVERESASILGMGIVLALLSGVWIARDIAASAARLSLAMEATGRLETFPPLPERADELGRLGESLEKMAGVLLEKDATLRATLREREETLVELQRVNQTLHERDVLARGYADFVRELKTLDLRVLMSNGLESLVRLGHALLGVVYLVSDAGELVPSLGVGPSGRTPLGDLFSTKGLAATVSQNKKPMFLSEKELGEGAAMVDLGVGKAPLRWVLAHPISENEGEAGAIVLGGAGVLPEERRELLLDAARQLSVGLHNAVTHERLRERTRMLVAQGESLAEANRVKTGFLTSMSHELRTPLHAIIGFADLLLSSPKESLSPRARESLERIHRNGENLLGLINDVLDLAKVEAGRAEVTFAETSMVDLVRESVGEVESLRAGRDLVLKVEAPASPVSIDTDPKRVRQILVNLVGNAIKFTDHGEVVVRLTVLAHEVQLAVSDTGIGIAPKDLESLFQDFHQIDKGDGRRYEGAGVGLALSRRLAWALGGDIRVVSELGKGSTFTLVLPKKKTRHPSVPPNGELA